MSAFVGVLGVAALAVALYVVAGLWVAETSGAWL